MLNFGRMTPEEILSIDRRHLWHPYSAFNADNPLYSVESANGVHIKLCDGRQLVDGMSSWWSAIHGYNHPELNKAATNQLAKMSHVMFGGLTHEPAARLAETLVEITPEPLQKVFLADSGSVSVEIAMKMALQYWMAKGSSGRCKFLTFTHGYHGDTLHPMSVTDPVNGMHHLFKNTLSKHIFAKSPRCNFDHFDETDLDDFKVKLLENKEEIAAVILEPIVQGAGGMRFYSPEILKHIRRLCDENNLLLIADEIATGFGRTGKMFACEHANISPDIMCIGKALTGGYLTLAATLCTENVADVICSGEAKVFMHGPTFMGNPLACAIANKSTELLRSEPYEWEIKIRNIAEWLTSSLSPAKDLPIVKDVRTLGAIGVIELKRPLDIRQLQPALVDSGVWLRPFGKLLYTMPPFIISEADCRKIGTSMCSVLEKF